MAIISRDCVLSDWIESDRNKTFYGTPHVNMHNNKHNKTACRGDHFINSHAFTQSIGYKNAICPSE